MSSSSVSLSSASQSKSSMSSIKSIILTIYPFMRSTLVACERSDQWTSFPTKGSQQHPSLAVQSKKQKPIQIQGGFLTGPLDSSLLQILEKVSLLLLFLAYWHLIRECLTIKKYSQPAKVLWWQNRPKVKSWNSLIFSIGGNKWNKYLAINVKYFSHWTAHKTLIRAESLK